MDEILSHVQVKELLMVKTAHLEKGTMFALVHARPNARIDHPCIISSKRPWNCTNEFGPF